MENLRIIKVKSHRDPSCALSDMEQQLTPTDLAKLLDRLVIRSVTTDNKLF